MSLFRLIPAPYTLQKAMAQNSIILKHGILRGEDTIIMLDDVMGNCNIIVENIQKKASAKNAISKMAVFFLLVATISMMMTLIPILLTQEAKAFSTPEMF